MGVFILIKSPVGEESQKRTVFSVIPDIPHRASIFNFVISLPFIVILSSSEESVPEANPPRISENTLPLYSTFFIGPPNSGVIPDMFNRESISFLFQIDPR